MLGCTCTHGITSTEPGRGGGRISQKKIGRVTEYVQNNSRHLRTSTTVAISGVQCALRNRRTYLSMPDNESSYPFPSLWLCPDRFAQTYRSREAVEADIFWRRLGGKMATWPGKGGNGTPGPAHNHSCPLFSPRNSRPNSRLLDNL